MPQAWQFYKCNWHEIEWHLATHIIGLEGSWVSYHHKKVTYVGFEILMVVNMKSTAFGLSVNFWEITWY